MANPDPQINKLRSGAQITASRWEGLQMPTVIQDAVRAAFRVVDRADRGEAVTAEEAHSAFTRICAAA